MQKIMWNNLMLRNKSQNYLEIYFLQTNTSTVKGQFL